MSRKQKVSRLIAIIAVAILSLNTAFAGTTVPIVIITPVTQPGDACIRADVASGEQTTIAKGDVVTVVRIHGANARRCPDVRFPNRATTRKLAADEQRSAPEGVHTAPKETPDVPKEQEIKREYDRLLAASAPAQEYHVRHILVRNRADAVAALDRIRAGSAFADVATEVSTDSGSKNKGGDLGWNVPSSFIEEFSKSMVSLAPAGLAAEPVKTKFGWHVIEVLETKVGKDSFPPLELVLARIAARLTERNRPASAASRVPAKAVCRNMAPPAASATSAKGTVTAEFRVENGKVTDILKLTGPAQLYPTVTDTVKKYECDRLDRATIAVQTFEF